MLFDRRKKEFKLGIINNEGITSARNAMHSYMEQMKEAMDILQLLDIDSYCEKRNIPGIDDTMSNARKEGRERFVQAYYNSNPEEMYKYNQYLDSKLSELK